MLPLNITKYKMKKSDKAAAAGKSKSSSSSPSESSPPAVSGAKTLAMALAPAVIPFE